MENKLIALPENIRFIVLGGILLVWFLVRGSQFLFTKSKANIPPGTPRDYGLAGGSVCPRCHRTIGLGLMAMKLGFGTKLVRCEFCGKWSVVRRLSLDELLAAEAAELTDVQPSPPIQEKSEAEKLEELVDQSRYTDKE